MVAATYYLGLLLHCSLEGAIHICAYIIKQTEEVGRRNLPGSVHITIYQYTGNAMPIQEDSFFQVYIYTHIQKKEDEIPIEIIIYTVEDFTIYAHFRFSVGKPGLL